MSKQQDDDRGYQVLKNKKLEMVSQLGPDLIRQAIYCPYSDRNYLIVLRAPPNSTKITVYDFKFNDEDPLDLKLDLSIVKEYDLIVDALYNNPDLVPMKKEKCFITVIYNARVKEIRKIEIETGKEIWSKSTKSNYVAVDSRGIIYSSTYDGKLVLRDPETGNILTSISIQNNKLVNGIAFDVNENLIIGGFNSKYQFDTRVYSRNGKLLHKLRKLQASFYVCEDPIKRMNYFLGMHETGLTRFNADYKVDHEKIAFGRTMCGFFLVGKNYKYLVICLPSSIEVYD